MFKKLLFGAAAAGAVVWLSKNQETAKRYVDRYAGQAKGAIGNATPGAGRAPAEERLNDPGRGSAAESPMASRARSSATGSSPRATSP